MRRPRSWAQWLRRFTQAAFLLIFFALLLGMRSKEGRELSPFVNLFFDLDPLVLLATWLATHTLSGLSLLALITVAASLLLGRVFCGWVCPLGTVHHAVSWLGTRRRKAKTQLADGAWSPWQRTKYLLLLAFLVMAIFGIHWIGMLDPFSLLYRSTVTAVLPAAQYAIEDSTTAVYQADPRLGPLRATTVTEPIYEFFRDHVFKTSRQTFAGSTVIFLFFVAIVLLNLVRKRFWCRYLCPLGALLGLCSKRPVMRLKNDTAKCTNCKRCVLTCPAGAQPDAPGEWRATECYACWNCVAACKENALGFAFESPLRKPTKAQLDLKRRAVLASGFAGLGGLLGLRLTPKAQATKFNPALIRPPGARPEREFLQRCIQCGACMKVCPTNALQPTSFEAGLEGIWTPILVPRIGYCEYECNLCGRVCPTEAIRPLPIEEKHKVKLGLARFDTTRCLPHAYARECLICEEHCPVPTKAIYFVEKEVPLRDGGTRVVKQPHVDPELCIGCGICESVCVFKDRPAVRVSSAGESRHTGNQPILPTPPDFGNYGGNNTPETGNADPYG